MCVGSGGRCVDEVYFGGRAHWVFVRERMCVGKLDGVWKRVCMGGGQRMRCV